MDENTIRQIVRDEIAKAAQQAQYTVTRVPVHTHNNTDAPNIPSSNVTGFQSLPAQPNQSPSGGVISLLMLDGQTVNGIPNTPSSSNPPAVYTYPVPFIWGYGVGTHSAFNGGTAPEGTLIAFHNGDGINQLWIMMESKWRGVNLDQGPIS